MDMILDFSEVKDYEPLPVGSFSVQIDKIEDSEDSQKRPQWQVFYTCTYPDFEGRSGRFYVSLAKEYRYTLYQLLKAIGFSSEELKDKSNPITVDKAKSLVIGQEVCIVLTETVSKSGKYAGQTFINVKYVEAADKAKGPATASPDAPKPDQGDALPSLFR
jgi:hypothetical protein